MTNITRFRARPFHSFKARQGNKLVVPGPPSDPRLMADAAFSVLDQLGAFRTLSEHEEIVTKRLGTADKRAIHAALEDLRSRGLLISEAEFFQTISAESPPAVISTIAIPTRGRSALLDRCISSYAAHACKFGREVRFVVAGADDRAPLEKKVDVLRAAGIDPAVARFALLGEAPGLPRGIARSTGANRNALLLECSGEAFLSVDDDTVCSLFPSPSYRNALAIHSIGSPLEMWFDPALPEIGASEELDLLAEVGRGLGPAIRREALLAPAEFDHPTLQKLLGGKARARLVQVGLSGDAATESPVGWLTASGPTRERLAKDEGGYLRAMSSRRVFMAAPCETVSESNQLMAYCLALDHRSDLPPFPPLGRDQDGIFGMWMRAADPENFTVHLPFAVAHEPAEARDFPADALRPRQGMSLNEALRLAFHGLEEGAAPGPVSSRLRWLGARLEEVADLPRADFAELLRNRRLKAVSRMIAYLERTLAAFGSRPAWWARDMQTAIRYCEQAMTDSHWLAWAEPNSAASPEDPLDVHQTYARWCAALLREWPAMEQAARQLRESSDKFAGSV